MNDARHGIIQLTFLRLLHADAHADTDNLDIQTIRLSRDPDGSGKPSPFDFTKSFMQPLFNFPDVSSVLEDVKYGHKNIIAIQMLNRVFC